MFGETSKCTLCRNPTYKRDGKVWCIRAQCPNSYWEQPQAKPSVWDKAAAFDLLMENPAHSRLAHTALDRICIKKRVLSVIPLFFASRHQ